MKSFLSYLFSTFQFSQLLHLHLLVICALLYLHLHYCTALFMQLWRVSHIIVTYINNTTRIFPYFLMFLIISKRIVQIQSSLIYQGQILCGVKNQKLMLSSSKVKHFHISKSYPGSSLIQFCLKGNNKSKSVSKKVVQCRSQPVIISSRLSFQ